MSIFEDKKHNNGKYVGQKPVSASPDELKGNTWGNFNRHVQWNHHVRHTPDPVSNVFPGNPGPPSASFDERFPRGVWSGGRGPSIDAAFSGPDPSETEFPLGRALRKKAKEMGK